VLKHYQDDGCAGKGAANNDDSKGNPATALQPGNFRIWTFCLQGGEPPQIGTLPPSLCLATTSAH
jgi:hypothetical protein